MLVSDDSHRGCAEVDQFWPFITVDERGYLHIVYYEACDNQCSGSDVVEIFPVYVFSDDGGATFQRHELGGSPTPTPVTVACAETWIGDYIGIDSGKERIYPLYTGPNGRIYSNRIDAAVFNPADFNEDCVVDLNDFNVFLLCFGVPVWRGCYLTNLTDQGGGNCVVDLNDYAMFATEFDKSCSEGWPASGQPQSPTPPGPLDVPALADWAVQHVPPSGRTHLAARSRALADRSDSAAEVATLRDFAALITP